jgi:flavin reductase (DIM6/NTAB) family NADH-FMN oxidoreductase RutF
MPKVTVDPMRPVYPTPAALITCVDPVSGRANIITLGEVFNVSLRRPPIVGLGIRKATWSHGLIAGTREFVVNIPTTAILRETDFCGSHSGRTLDKFAETGLTPLPATHVRPPLIAQCPVNIECRLLSVQEVGDHDLFLGEVLEVHADDTVLDADGRVSPGRLDALVFMFNCGHAGEYWRVSEKLGDVHATRRGSG